MEDEYGIQAQLSKKMKRNRPDFKNLLKKEERRGTTKAVRKIPFPLIEDGVLQYFELACKSGLPITKRYLMTIRQAMENILF